MATILDRVLEEAIKPRAKEIATIWHDFGLPVVFFEVDGAGAAAAKALGWTGGRVEVQRINVTQAEKIASSLPANDAAASAWFRRRVLGRILVYVQSGGNLLVNYKAGVGYSIEPGTLDREMMI